MAVPATSVVRAKTDGAVLTELQELGTDTEITAYSSLIGQVVTWADPPSAIERNAVLAYFQQGNHLESV